MTIHQNLEIRQGETWSWVYICKLNGTPVNLTDYSARMSIKQDYHVDSEAYLSTGSDADGGRITLGGALGTVTLAMTAAETTALLDDLSYYAFVNQDKRAPVQPVVEWIYDLELVAPSGAVTRELEGKVRIHRNVTAL
jgi:hypothetical protein